MNDECQPRRQSRFQQAVAAGREDLVRLAAGGSVRWQAVVSLALRAPTVLTVLGLGLGGVLFLATAASAGWRFAAALGPALVRAGILADAGARLSSFLTLHEVGPQRFQQTPLGFAVYALLCLCVGVAAMPFLAWAVRRALTRLDDGPATVGGLPGLLGRDWGRGLEAWECLAGSRDSLRRKTVVGSQYLLVQAAVRAGTDVIKITVFGWILGATDYGIQTLVMIVISLADSFTGMGLDVMIQRDGDDVKQRLPTYWTLQLTRALCLFAIVWVAAPLVAAFYQQEILATQYSPTYFVWLLRIVALSFLLKGLAGFGRELRQRDMDFKPVMQADILAGLVSLALSLTVLWLTRSVWALATLVLADALGVLVVSYWLSSWRPRLAWNSAVVRTVASFSLSIVCITILNAISNRMDHATVGKLLGVAALGFYGRAYGLATVPCQNLANVVAPVMLPAMRAVASDPVRFRRAFTKCLLVYAVAALAAVAVFGVLVPPFVQYVLGHNGYWLPILPPLYVLLLFSVMKTVSSVIPATLFVLNKPWLISLCTAVSAATMLICIVPMTRWFGVLGAAWCVVLASLLSNSLAVWFVYHYLPAGRPAATADSEAPRAGPAPS